MYRKMKISIITVCYNSAATIEKTFVSVKDQTYKDIEYIVVDGGSKDGTLAIMNTYSDVVSQWISEPDKGLYDAMNKGIQLATGALVGILNSDDIFTDNHVIENIANFHLKNTIDASVGNIIQFNKEGKTVRKYAAKNWNPEKLKIGFMPPHPSIFFKRELFKRLGLYDLTFKSGADYELIIRYFLENKITYKYSDITTTSMAMGGISSSGMESYKMITKEICKALKMNNISFSPLKVKLRAVWKIWSFLSK
jgi:glycosyltransferase involved in cell wall biosynthesis